MFVKSIYHLHNAEYDDGLRIWDDVPLAISEGEHINLPVDAVILHIFEKQLKLRYVTLRQSMTYCKAAILTKIN